MIFFANFDYLCAPLGITVNVEVTSDEDIIKGITLSNVSTGRLLKTDELPKADWLRIQDSAGYAIDMQVKAREEERNRDGKDFAERLWDIGSSMNTEMAEWMKEE